MPRMNWVTTADRVRWILRDLDTGLENDAIDWRFRRGDVVRIRLRNDRGAVHAMQHPVHIHGQRFLVLSRDGVPERQPGLEGHDAAAGRIDRRPAAGVVQPRTLDATLPRRRAPRSGDEAGLRRRGGPAAGTALMGRASVGARRYRPLAIIRCPLDVVTARLDHLLRAIARTGRSGTARAVAA